MIKQQNEQPNRPAPWIRVDTRPRCVHCGQPFDAELSEAGEFGLCDECLFTATE